ncbi:RHS repeat-associated core domain-containing protein, partial [Luteimonas sp. SJ-92]
FGPAAGWTYGNGRRLDRVHDLDYRPASISDPAAGGLDFGYSYDPVGNLTALHTADLAEPPRASFDYDPLGRLTAFRDGAASTAIESYGYDVTGNRTSFTNAGGSQAYSYPTDSHRLAAVAGVARSYDNAGNTLAIGTAREFVYNAANRMSQAKQGGAVAMHYVYNGKGEQVRRHLGSSDTTTVFDEAGRWLGDYDAAGNPLQQAIWLDDYPVGLLVGASGINRLHYVQPDHLGTPRAVIDPVRSVAVWNWDLASEAFGNSPPNEDPDADGTGFVFDMRFPGQRYDAASALSQNYFRDYEPETGRYSQSDPIGFQGGIATYGYAYSNSLLWQDARGLSPITCSNIEAHVGVGSTGTIQCDGRGGYEIVNCASPCMRSCTQAHEQQHISDYVARYGSRSCANRRRGSLPDDERVAPRDMAHYDHFRDMSECRAYGLGLQCAKNILDSSCECKEEAEQVIRSAERERRELSCSMYGF